MARTKQLERTITLTPKNVTSVVEWNGFQRGDLCRIKGERGSYKFMGHCTHTNGNQWVAVYGGDKNPLGYRQFRYVEPDRIVAMPAKRSQGA